MKTYFPALLLLTMALASCETTVDLPEPPHTPRVALMHTLTSAPTDSTFPELYRQRQLYVSNSQRVFDTRQLLGRGDAAVEIRNGSGVVVERYRPFYQYQGQEPGYYRPTLGLVPQPGQTYTLRATLPGFEPVESTLTMPRPVVVESGTFVPRANPDNPYQQEGRLTVVVQDDPATANYYLVYARVLDKQGNPASWSAVDIDIDSDVVGVGQFEFSSVGQEYAVSPFADTDVNGQRLTVASDVYFHSTTYNGGGSPTDEPGYIEVYVSCITADTYNFYLSRRRYYDSDDNPFAEPAPLFSNIKPGYGLFAGATNVKYRIKIF